jgi:hypothetical protein
MQDHRYINLDDTYLIKAYSVTEKNERVWMRKDKFIHPVSKMEIKIPTKLFKNYDSSWTFSIFNVYNRHNPYIIYFANEGSATQGNLTIKAKQVYLFPILPSVTWNFKF